MTYPRTGQFHQVDFTKFIIYDLIFRAHFFENFHEQMNLPKSIQNHSGMVPGASGHCKTFKNLQIFSWESLGASGKNLKKSSENIVLNDFLDLFFQIFPCWRMYCPCGGTRGHFLHSNSLTRRAYTVCFRVIRRQRGARLNFSVNRHLGDFRASGSQVGDVLHNRLSP